MAFRIGQRVVCINDGWVHSLLHLLRFLPKKGEIYTIRGIPQMPGGDVGLLFEEGLNDLCQLYKIEPSFSLANFRPMTDISIFIAMLDQVKEDA